MASPLAPAFQFSLGRRTARDPRAYLSQSSITHRKPPKSVLTLADTIAVNAASGAVSEGVLHRNRDTNTKWLACIRLSLEPRALRVPSACPAQL
jgi:hypothetical protein